VQYALASLALSALGAMMFAPHRFVQRVGLVLVGSAYLPLLSSAATEDGLFRAIRWAPVAILAVTTLLLLRSGGDRTAPDASPRFA
jgi:hypothetical protein